MTPAPAEPPAPVLLFVCTANLCRSPLAAALTRRALGDGRAKIGSAGFLPGGHPVPETGLRIGAELGLDLAAHRSRQLNTELLDDADVILTMTREQGRELVANQPGLWPRVFTVKQFARWLGAHQPPATGMTREWLAAAAADRGKSDLLGTDERDEVGDPMGRSARVWRRVAAELGDAADAIAAGLAPLSPPSTP